MVDCNIVCLCFLAIFAKFNSQQNYNTVNFGFKKKKLIAEQIGRRRKVTYENRTFRAHFVK